MFERAYNSYRAFKKYLCEFPKIEFFWTLFIREMSDLWVMFYYFSCKKLYSAALWVYMIQNKCIGTLEDSIILKFSWIGCVSRIDDRRLFSTHHFRAVPKNNFYWAQLYWKIYLFVVQLWQASNLSKSSCVLCGATVVSYLYRFLSSGTAKMFRWQRVVTLTWVRIGFVSAHITLTWYEEIQWRSW